MTRGARFDELARPLEAHLAALLARTAAPELGQALLAIGEARCCHSGDDATVRHLDDAAGAVRAWSRSSADTSAQETLDGIDRLRRLALDRLEASGVGPPATEPSPPLVASHGRPAIHRGVALRDAPRAMTPREFGALSARRAPTEVRSRARAQLERWATGELEEIAAMGSLRSIRDDDAWTSGMTMEARLLASLDALVSLGRLDSEAPLDLGAACADYVQAMPVPDRGRTFSQVFVLGCLDSPAALGHLLMASRSARPEVRPSLVDALCLASSPWVAELAEALLFEDDEPALLAIALDVLARRSIDGGPPVLQLIEHPDPRVARRAILASRWVRSDDRGALLVRALDGPAPVALEAAMALSIARSSLGATHLRKMSEDPQFELRGAALLGWAIASRPKEAQDVIEVATRGGAAGVEALGWLGHEDALPFLLDALDASDPSEREAARWALTRLTGKGLERWASDGEPPPAERTTWRGWLDGLATPRGARLRLGRPLDAAATVAELVAPRTLQRTRRTLLFELMLARTGAWVDLDDWIPSQLEALHALRGARDPGAAVARTQAGIA